MSAAPVIDPLVQSMHDELLAKLPEGSTHVSDECAVCIAAATEEEPSVTITDAEVQAKIDAAVAAATAPLVSELDQLRESQSAAAQEAALAAAREPLEARIAELETQLDVKTNELAAAETRWTEAEEFLNAAAAAAEQEAEIAARAEEREAKVREVASFKDDYYTDERIGKWAAMEQDAFDDLLAQLAETASAAGGRKLEVPRPSAMTAAERGAGGGRRPAPGPRTAALQTAVGLRNRGIRPNQI